MGELAFNITTKIRLDPDILSAWFKSQPSAPAERKEQDAHERFTGRAQKQDFPLFYLLVDYIHHEGKVGDFARTGLLYIIEAASSSVPLEQWIVESDLSTPHGHRPGGPVQPAEQEARDRPSGEGSPARARLLRLSASEIQLRGD